MQKKQWQAASAMLIACAGLSFSAPLLAQIKDIVADPKKSATIPYVIDHRGVVARSNFGLCWRTGFWTPQLAAQYPEVGCACDADLLPKEVCAPPAPKTEAPVPAAPPATSAAPAAPPAAAPKAISLSAKSLFEFDKAVLTAEGRQTLDKEILARLAEFGKVNAVIVSGHTDRMGSATYNQLLSERRAEAVKAYLVGKGVSAEAIETYGFGKTQPIPEVKCSDNLKRSELIQCLLPNRRVVVEVKGDPK